MKIPGFSLDDIYFKVDKNCLKAIEVLKNKETSFGWEERLVDLIKN